MARPKSFTLTLNVDPNGLCQDQTTAGSGNLTLNGALVGTVTSGVYNNDTPQIMQLESAGNLSGVTFTFTGKGYDSNSRYSDSISEAVTGPNAGTQDTTNYFTEITQVAVDGAVGTNVEIGPAGKAISKIYPLNWRRREDVGVSASVSGTINYDVDVTLSDIQDLSVTPAYLIDASVIANKAVNADMTIDGGATGIRVQVNSGNDAGAVTVDIVQS